MYRDHNDREQVSRYDVSSYARTTGTGTKRKAPRNKRRLNRTARLFASAMLFWLRGGGTFYGTQALLQNNGTAQIQQEESAVVATNAAYTAASTAYTGWEPGRLRHCCTGPQVGRFGDQHLGAGSGQLLWAIRPERPRADADDRNGELRFGRDHRPMRRRCTWSPITTWWRGASTLSVTFAGDQTYQAQLCGYDEQERFGGAKGQRG